MARSPVLVTGTAAATCCGLGSVPLWERIARREAGGRVRGAAMRSFPPLPTEPARGENRLVAYVLAALDHDLGRFLEALPEDDREDAGVALGSAYGYLGPYLSYLQVASEEGYQLVNPRHFPHTLPNASAVSVSDAFRLWGSSTAVATGLGAGLEAIAYAAECIRRGDEQTMLAGACEELNTATARAADAEHGPSSPSPDGRGGQGVRPGEAVGILLLQSSEAAAAAGRQPFALCCGVATRQGISWDAPASRGKAIEAIRDAVRASDLAMGDIAAVFPSAGGSARADSFEAEVLEGLFGPMLATLDVVPIKPITGECFAASGALQCLAAVQYLAAAEGDDSDRPPAALVCASGYDGSFAAAVFVRAS